MLLKLLGVDSARDHQKPVFRSCGDPTVTAPPPPHPLASQNSQLGILKSETCFLYCQVSNAISLVIIREPEVHDLRFAQNGGPLTSQLLLMTSLDPRLGVRISKFSKKSVKIVI